MKITWACSLVALIASLAGPEAVRAQSIDHPRGDAAGFLGWQVADAGSADPVYRTDWESSLFGGGSLGMYWTVHWKTEVDAGASRRAFSYRSRPLPVTGVQTHQASTLQFSRRTISISQQYQFYDNVWFHPHVAAGVNVTWERRIEEFSPAYTYDPVTGAAGLTIPGRVEGPATDVTLRPFVATGFKAYVAPQWFLRLDARFAFRRGFEESHLRFGVGRDW